MTLRARPLASGIGFEILGLDLTQAISEDDRQAVLDAWIDGGIVLIRGCDSQEKQLRLSECFGTLEASATRDLNMASSPYLMELRFDPAAARSAPGPLMRINGRERAGWLGWH